MKVILCLVLIAVVCAQDSTQNSTDFLHAGFFVTEVQSYLNSAKVDNVSAILACVPQGNITFAPAANTTNATLTADSWVGAFCQDLFNSTNFTNASITTSLSYNLTVEDGDILKSSFQVTVGSNPIEAYGFFNGVTLGHYANGSQLVTTDLVFDYVYFNATSLNVTGHDYTVQMTRYSTGVVNSAVLRSVSGALVVLIALFAF